jgi:hypothetical protein
MLMGLAVDGHERCASQAAGRSVAPPNRKSRLLWSIGSLVHTVFEVYIGQPGRFRSRLSGFFRAAELPERHSQLPMQLPLRVRVARL